MKQIFENVMQNKELIYGVKVLKLNTGRLKNIYLTNFKSRHTLQKNFPRLTGFIFTEFFL